ncbi:MAG TPA: AraC family transcriptional regulator [Candidatus Binatia bacterium]|nr:AraC family transcriptional regulator [Candidatus Binatia bacterium]
MTASTPKSPSTLGSWSAAILRALEARGIDAQQLAREAGIDPVALQSPDARVPRAALTQLWHLAVAATGDPSFGLSAPRFVTQTSFHALGYAVLASATLKEALERIVRYRRLIGDVVQLSLTERGDRYRFTIDVSAPPGAPVEAVDAIAAMTVRQARLLSGDRSVTPLAVMLQRPAPADVHPFRRLFGVEVAFLQPLNALEFSRAEMERPLPAANAELARQNEQIIASYLARLQQPRVSTRVEDAVLTALPDGAPSKQAIARQLGMSPRNLQRHLANEGTSFKDLLNNARVTLARNYVREGRLSVTEIAFMLGFADTSTFSRAFKRWTGTSPRDYAKRL